MPTPGIGIYSIATLASIYRVSSILLALALLGAAACTHQVRDSAAGNDLAIQNVNVVDVRQARVRAGMTVVIRGDRIVEVVAAGELPANARIVDGSGKFLIPGLWDMHFHLAALEPDPRAVEKLVAHGVLGIRDMGGRVAEVERLRSDVQAGVRIGPRIVRAGPTLNSNQPADFHVPLQSADEGRAMVRKLSQAGVDFIKVHNGMKPEVFLAVIAEASKVDLAVVGHVPYGLSLIEASNAGMKSIEHAEVLVETEIKRQEDAASGIGQALEWLEGERGQQVFQSFVANGTALTPTFSAYAAFVASQEDGNRRQMGETLLGRWKGLIRTAHLAGVAILAGTDGMDPGPDGGMRLARELEHLVEAGLSPAEALGAATHVATSFLGLDDEGEIAPGKKANAVLLDANPLQDIRNVARVHAVVLRGRFLGAAELKAEIEPRDTTAE